MFRFTTSKTQLCMDRARDMSERLLELSAAREFGSPDPHSDSFDPIAYLFSEWLTKHPSLGTAKSPDDRRRLAFAKLMASDKRMSDINEQGFGNPTIRGNQLCSLLTTAQTLIGNLLVGFEHHFLDGCYFSNGASQGFKLRDAAPYKKIAGQATVTARAYDIAVHVVKLDPLWYSHMQETYGDETRWFRRVYGNGVFTVPKNNQIDRAACKEPDMNMYLQKSAGSFIRSRLKSVGIDLNDQSRNQELARLASIDGSLATIDLSSASDSISDRLAFELLPPHIYSYLDMIRSHRTIVDGECHPWSLFSTMGNGFTFELESLIFWAIAKACQISSRVDGSLGVYGDDIIVPVEVAPLLIDVLGKVGFLTNSKKTFTTGFFRESCGGHYFKGMSVKPFYIRRPIVDLPTTILIANRIRAWGNCIGMADPRLYELWKELAEMVPNKLKGGCDLTVDTSLVTPPVHGGGYKLERQSRVSSGFDKTDKFSPKDHIGRLVAWLHVGCGEVINTVTTPRFSLTRDRNWRTPIPYFPQEIGSRELS